MRNLTSLFQFVRLGFVVSLFVMFLLPAAQAQEDTVHSGRFRRGAGTNATFQSFVIPLDGQKGLECADLGGLAENTYPFFSTFPLRWHYDAETTDYDQLVSNPIGAFGSRAGGSPLYFGQEYRFAAYSGLIPPNNDIALALHTFVRTNGGYVYLGETLLPLPNPTNTSEWRAYLTNGYSKTFVTNGLTTVISFNQIYPEYGVTLDGPIVLTHTASLSASNFLFEVEILGGIGTGAPMITDLTLTYFEYSPLYTVEFEQRPPWRSVFIDQPHFAGEPLPPAYNGKSIEELLSNSVPMAVSISLSNAPSTYTNLDQSPELRRHPILDQFVTDFRNDPIALTRHVFNEIELTDALDYNDNGSVTEVSVNQGGVSRGALATFLEGQGSPAEQCALLIYLLRQSGTPAVYVYPAHNTMKMLDVQLSRILRMQMSGSVDNNGLRFTTNSLVPVNYPWVAAYIGTNWVHLFPWIKDTMVDEGFSIRDYMGTQYPNGFKWVQGYVFGETNITSLATNGDDTAGTVFERYLSKNLSLNAPGLSMGDIGVRYVNRKNSYARWSDFPTPLVTPTNGVPLDSLTSSAITNIYVGLTNVFDTYNVEVSSHAAPTKKIQTGDLRLVDLHNRRFLIRHEKTGVNTHNIILSLDAFRTNATGLTNFTVGDSLLNSQVKMTNLISTDNTIDVLLTYKRHRSLPITIFTNNPGQNANYPRVAGSTTITDTRTIQKGDLAAICLNVGRVTRSMLNVHAQALWNMERTLQATPSATNTISADLYQGGVAYLMGMAYFENVSSFSQENQRLHKVRVVSHFAQGLAKLGAKRVSGALPNSGDVILNQPSVDMYQVNTVLAFGANLHPNSGEEKIAAIEDFGIIETAHKSSEEHGILNSFFGQSDSVSTTKLLQLAQARSGPTRTGIMVLNFSNYLWAANSNISGTLLQNYDKALWSQVTNYLGSSEGSVRQAFITPGTVTNQTKSYKGMGVLLISPGLTYGALISSNQNGAFAPTVPDSTFNSGNTINYSLNVNPDDSFSLNYTAPSAAVHVAAPDSFAGYDSSAVASTATQGYYDYSPFQNDWSATLVDKLGLTPQAANQNFSQGIQAADGNQGYLGWNSDALNQASSGVADPVHMVTGEFYVNAQDLALPGPMPLVINRNYSSLNTADNQFGFGWKLNYMPFLSFTATTNVIYAAEADGAVLAYEQTATNVNLWLPTLGKNPQLNNNSRMGIGSTANRMRNRIEKRVSGNTFFDLFNPDGSRRIFQVTTFSGGGINRTRPYLSTWTDNRGNSFSFQYGQDFTQPDFGEVRRIQSSNGGYLGFVYDVYGHVIEAYTGDGRRLSYFYDRFGDLARVTFPDASEISYEYEHKNLMVTNGATITTNLYSSHLLTKETKPDGRLLANAYDNQRRVTNQLSTVGVDLNPIRNASFVYSNNFKFTNAFTNTITGYTLVSDVNNNVSRYDYASSLITNITDQLTQTIAQLWYSGNPAVPGYPCSLWKKKDKRGLWTEFQYDSFGNVTNTITWGDLLGNGGTNYATNTIVYDTNNLPIEAMDALRNKTKTIYSAAYPFLPEQNIHYAGSSPIATNFMGYYNVTNTVVSGSLTNTNTAFGLLQMQIRAFNSPDATTNLWSHDGRGFILQEIRFTGTSDPAITNAFFYNDRGEMIEKTDAAGRKARFDYDGLGRPKLHEVFEAGQTRPVSGEYSYYNENGELTWSDGPRYDPEDYVWRDYDGAGRITTEIHWRSEANADGSGVSAPTGDNLYATTFRDYDSFGNLKRVTDPRGGITTNSWDALGRLIGRRMLEFNGTTLTTEGFAYEPGGQVIRHTNGLGGITEYQYTSTGQIKSQKNPDGSTNLWRYYVDGRVSTNSISNQSYWKTIYDDVNLTTTRILYSAGNTPLTTNSTVTDRRGNTTRQVDAAGYSSTNVFDGLDRLKAFAGPYLLITNEIPSIGPNTPIQQAFTNYFAAAGQVLTKINALGEKFVTYADALGRTTRSEVRDSNDTLVRESTFGYAANHHSVSTTNGSGASAIGTTIFSDNDGHTLLSLSYPSSGVHHFSLSEYDMSGNLAFVTNGSSTNGNVVFWSGTAIDYDGMNRVIEKADRDSADTFFSYDAGNHVTNRTMPGGLEWRATFSTAGQVVETKNVATNGAVTHTNGYTYYGPTSAFAGLLQTDIDSRGVACTHYYDEWLRPASNVYSGSLSEQRLVTEWRYDARGLVTSITERFATNSTGPDTSVSRTYDAYGLLKNENITYGTNLTTASQSWDSGGKRNQLTINGQQFDQAWRADGRLLSSSGSYYTYDTAGQLATRTVATRKTTISGRDGSGRIVAIDTTYNFTNVLNETLSWTGDDLLSTHAIQRPDYTDQRQYFYADLSRRVTEERLRASASRLWTNVFSFDANQPSGPGVLTRMADPSSAGSSWKGGVDAFSRISSETNNVIRRTAYGRVNGLAGISALLDGQPMPVTTVGTGDPLWTNQWRATLELTPGVHQLNAMAVHPSGSYTTNASAYFTNSIGSITSADTYDGSGFLTQRVWKNPNLTTNLVQTLSWDAKGQLYKISERDANSSGYDWQATYDALGRRIQTKTIIVTNATLLTAQARIIIQYYDPLREFLEIGVTENLRTTWKVYGPDADGTYGGLNGMGGFDAIIPGPHLFCPIISDARGNLHAIYDREHAGLVWYESRPTGYGAIPGYRPPPLGSGADVAGSSAWRGCWPDVTGLYCRGARYYDPAAGRFLSPDPSGHDASPDLYSAFNGDPINYWDSDGRQGFISANPTAADDAARESAMVRMFYPPPDAETIREALVAHARISGALGLAGGVIETTIGAATIPAGGIGFPIAGHGLDVAQANARQILSGKHTQTFTAQGVGEGAQFLGASPEVAGYIGTAFDMGASLASGFAKIPTRGIDPSRASPNTVLSGHGSYDLGNGLTVTPDGVTLRVYTKFGGTISDQLGNAIETGANLSGVPVTIYEPGSTMPNYTLHPPDWRINIMGDPITVTQPTSLKSLLYPNMGTVDWAACCFNPAAPQAGSMGSYSPPTPNPNGVSALGGLGSVNSGAITPLSKH